MSGRHTVRGRLTYSQKPRVFARIRSFAHNILRINQSDSIARDPYAAALGGLDFLLSLKFYRER